MPETNKQNSFYIQQMHKTKESIIGPLYTEEECLKIIDMCRLNILPRVVSRLTEAERESIQPGCIYVYEEEESGISRWTDGKLWSPSKVFGKCLIYKQLCKSDTPKRNTQPSTTRTTTNNTNTNTQAINSRVPQRARSDTPPENSYLTTSCELEYISSVINSIGSAITDNTSSYSVPEMPLGTNAINNGSTTRSNPSETTEIEHINQKHMQASTTNQASTSNTKEETNKLAIHNRNMLFLDGIEKEQIPFLGQSLYHHTETPLESSTRYSKGIIHPQGLVKMTTSVVYQKKIYHLLAYTTKEYLEHGTRGPIWNIVNAWEYPRNLQLRMDYRKTRTSLKEMDKIPSKRHRTNIVSVPPRDPIRKVQSCPEILPLSDQAFLKEEDSFLDDFLKEYFIEDKFPDVF
ncbi:hypothetical protein NEOKW01_1223 [Nematocida sp. AWRm80]|nr:hypothetical protein NEOKW01_1223 [Nematocida sp. AWRm80]